MTKFLFLFCGCFAAVRLQAQQLSVIPEPAEMIMPRIAASFPIGPATKIFVSGSETERTVSYLNNYLQKQYGFTCAVQKGEGTGIRLHGTSSAGEASAYRIAVNAKGILVEGADTGMFYGIQTLIQLLVQKTGTRQLAVPYVNIKDQPRFSYRGMHLDVARHFMDVDFVKKYIDYLALHKFNYFHWHLTDDQGWRIEIKKYPRLTSVGGFRNGTIIGRFPGTGNDGIRTGGFYTQEQVKEVVKYAADRFIMVIPEIEMPGHASAAIAAYPELSCFPNEPTITYYPKQCAWAGDSTGKQVIQSWGVYDDVFAPTDKTFGFLEDVIDEVIALFPSKYIHVGGDECPKNNWKKSEFCQNLIKEKNLKDEHGLQSYFIQRMEKYINSKGRTIIGWDEILEGGLAPNAMVMSWRGEEGGIEAAKQNHDVIMTPGSHVYFDFSQTRNEDSVTIGGFTPLEKTYSYEPVPAALPADKAGFVLGAQANLWTEYIKNPQKVEYMVFPRIGALSEVLWSPKAKRNWQRFAQKVPVYMQRLDQWGINYSKAFFDVKPEVGPSAQHRGISVRMEKSAPGVVTRYRFVPAGQATAAAADYKTPLQITTSGLLTAWNERNGNAVGAMAKLDVSFNKATGKAVTVSPAPAKNYPGQGGVFGLVNGLRSTTGMNSAEWLGWDGKDVEFVVDLLAPVDFSTVGLHTIASGGSWVYPPSAIEVFVSNDGAAYSSIGKTGLFQPAGNSVGLMTVKTSDQKARFVKIKAANFGPIPEGASGAGKPAWLFADEIEVF